MLIDINLKSLYSDLQPATVWDVEALLNRCAPIPFRYRLGDRKMSMARVSINPISLSSCRVGVCGACWQCVCAQKAVRQGMARVGLKLVSARRCVA
jgi:hypothetical protein